MLFFKLLRVKHWIKNIVILLPLIFSCSFTDVANIRKSLVAMLSFCFIASAVYILNDIIDVESDRKHILKKNRPIASGKISIFSAILVMSILIFVATYVTYKINFLSLGLILGYLFFNILYSLYLKQIVIFDVFCIAIFFMFRIFLGCVVINLFPSEYMILSTLFLSLLLGFSKRYMELKISNKKISSREVLKLYNVDILKQFIVLSATLSIIFYTMYTLTSDVSLRLHSKYIYLSVFPITYFILRILFLINVENDDDPSELFYNDNQIKISLGLFFLLIFALFWLY